MISVQVFLLQMLVLSLFLLAGYLLRVKVRFFQKLFLPAPVIGGALGLLCGPELLGRLLPLAAHGTAAGWLEIYRRDWIPVYRLLPGVLITPVMAASILGMRIPDRREMIESVGRQLGYMIAFCGSQFALGAAVGAFFLGRIYPTFGLELFAGFAGGHGTAGIYGQTLRELGAGYWQTGQGVAVTTATFGLIFGVVGGIWLINLCARRGETSLLSSPETLPEELRTGLYRIPGQRRRLGASVTASDVLDPLSYTVALIAIPSLSGILLRRMFVYWQVPGLLHVGDYAWALVASAVLWTLVVRRGYGWILDEGAKNRIAGAMVDFLVVAAIVSMPLEAVLSYLVPILVLMIAGAGSAVAMFYLGRRLLPDHWVERSIMTFGQCTGVTATGLLLLRIVDPEFETPALSAWGLSYAFAFPAALVYLGLGPSIIARFGPWSFAALSLVIMLAGIGSVFLFPHPRKARSIAPAPGS